MDEDEGGRVGKENQGEKGRRKSASPRHGDRDALTGRGKKEK